MSDSRSIAVIAPLHGEGLFSGLRRYCGERTNWTFFVTSRSDRRTILGLPRLADGVIADAKWPETAKALVDCGLPIVNLSRAADRSLPSVLADDLALGRLGAQHLLECGYHSFAFCGSRRGPIAGLKLKGFTGRLAEAGYDCQVYRHPRAKRLAIVKAAMEQWIAGLLKPVGVLATNASLGCQLLEACRALLTSVPQHVGVVYAGTERAFCGLVSPPLSCVCPDEVGTGFQAAALLDDLISGKRASPSPILVPPAGVKTRKSTAMRINDLGLAQALQYIQEHACDPIAVSDIVNCLLSPESGKKLSRRSLERRFAKVLGHGPAAAIRHVQLDRAKRLLLETDLPTWRIARAAGFGDAPHLSKVFRRELGVPPTDFRKRASQRLGHT